MHGAPAGSAGGSASSIVSRTRGTEFDIGSTRDIWPHCVVQGAVIIEVYRALPASSQPFGLSEARNCSDSDEPAAARTAASVEGQIARFTLIAAFPFDLAAGAFSGAIDLQTGMGQGAFSIAPRLGSRPLHAVPAPEGT
jgi:hypothetical protein